MRMKLYITNTSPYARLARIVVIEKGLHDRVRILQAETRTQNSHVCGWLAEAARS